MLNLNARPSVTMMALAVMLMFPCLDANAAIVQEEVVSGGTISTSLTLPSIQGGTDQTYVLYIATRHNQDVSDVTGGGLTWTERNEQCAGRAQTGIRVWTAQGSPSSFQAEITITASKPVSAVLVRYSGVDSFEDPMGENTNGELGGCSSGADDTASQVTLTSAAANAVHTTGLAPRNRNIDTFTSGYAEVATDVAGTGGEMTKIYVYEKAFGSPTTDTFSATLSSDQDWAMNGVVLVAVALPVELTDFAAVVDDGALYLSWTTLSESGNAGFEVQWRALSAGGGMDPGEPGGEVVDAPMGGADRSGFATNWTMAGFVPGYGTTSEAHTYAFQINGLASGVYRLRLKQVDVDGSITYSDEVEADIQPTTAVVVESIFPNPARSTATFRFAVQDARPVRVDLFDLLGRQVQTLYAGVPPGGEMQSVTIDGAALPRGMYLVRVDAGSFVETRKVVLR